jgi:hypothetical protein
MLRNFVAFLLSPLPAAIFHAGLVALWPQPGLAIYRHPASMFAAIFLFQYAFGLVFGVPLYLLVRNRVSKRLLPYALGGLAVVIVPMGISVGLIALRQAVPLFPAGYSFFRFGFGGLLTGAAFWSIARPDRRAAAAAKARLSAAFD